jgi:hypothetical protein
MQIAAQINMLFNTVKIFLIDFLMIKQMPFHYFHILCMQIQNPCDKISFCQATLCECLSTSVDTAGTSEIKHCELITCSYNSVFSND